MATVDISMKLLISQSLCAIYGLTHLCHDDWNEVFIEYWKCSLMIYFSVVGNCWLNGSIKIANW